MVMEAKKIEQSKCGQQQRLLTDLPIMAYLKSRSTREKSIYNFEQMIVDKGEPLSCVDEEFYRKLVYRSYGVVKCDNPVCKKTVRAVLVELMGLVEDKVKIELVCLIKLLCNY